MRVQDCICQKMTISLKGRLMGVGFFMKIFIVEYCGQLPALLEAACEKNMRKFMLCLIGVIKLL